MKSMKSNQSNFLSVFSKGVIKLNEVLPIIVVLSEAMSIKCYQQFPRR